MSGRPVFAIFETTTAELVGFHPFADLDAALADLYGYIEARAVDPSHCFQVLEVGTADPCSSTGIRWLPEPLLRASVLVPLGPATLH